MAGPYPLPTLAPTITAQGISIPSFEDVLASLQASYRAIYGQDVDLAADTQDGQWIAVQAQAIYDLNDVIVQVYNSFSPSYAQRTQLSSLVKINGLRRQNATQSTAPVELIGQAGTFIAAGILADDFGNDWFLPSNVMIPLGGSITVTMTCDTPGAVTLSNGSTTIGTGGGLTFVTIVAGWQSATTTSAAAVGLPVETDSTLRQRQAVSTSLPASTPLQALLGAVANLPGVERYAVYENDTSVTLANGIPPHSIAVVIEGGSVTQVAQAIELFKNPGTSTYGTTQEVVLDPAGVPDTINLYILTEQSVYVAVVLTPLTGWSTATGTLIQNSVAAYVGGLPAGQNVEYNKIWASANLSGTAATTSSGLGQPQLDQLSTTFEITSLLIGTNYPPTATIDIAIPFYAGASCPALNVTVTP